MKQPTLKDLAKHLLLSTSTVSRALTNDKNVRRETREQVQEAAQRLGYKPNRVARNLKSGRSYTIGVIVPEMVTPFASSVLEGIQDAIADDGYHVIIAQSGEDPKIERKNLMMMQQALVDGVIISACHQTYNLDLCREFQYNGIPLVFYDRILSGLDAPRVMVNDYTKSMLMMEHLIHLGRKKIVHLQAPDYIYNSVERSRAYRDAHTKFGLNFDPALLVRAGLTFEDGRNAAARLLIAEKSFDAIFAFTDTLAIGAMNYLREKGLRIPQDVAIASFSGTALSTIVHPQLTTVEQPLHEMGVKAANLLLRLIDGVELIENRIVLDATLQYRGSTILPAEERIV
ncbi:LacI family DNA-binding transcriptional regulator [Sphingobacterium chungjuense]|uniref:LacI family DNA-binding transcriptional regulator n=1 Tax=Sphingobacterium chungjuense TaxID=2675553 RepID=UPI00140D7374|nr:LacI family DNA-binding transcriptional regulator [Sphingobacterium chungjuense]